MFSVFSVFTQTPQNKYIVDLYQKVLLGYFSEDRTPCTPVSLSTIAALQVHVSR